MKVDLVIGSLQMGGAERQLTGLAIELRRMGTDVEVVVLRSSGHLTANLVDAGVPVVCLDEFSIPGPRFTSVRVGLQLARHWRARRPDAVQAWLGEAQVTALPLARVMRIPVRVMAIRSLSSAVRMTPLKERGLRVAALSSTSIIANSNASLSDPGWPISGLSHHMVPNAVDLPESVADPAAVPPMGVVLANLLPYKGHTVLLDALAQLPEPPRIIFVGTGPMHAEITRRAEALSLAKSMEIVEGVPDPWPFLLESQFSVLPSLTEGMPNAVLESMAAGLPVIASRVGAVPDLVADGDEGLLVPPGDVSRLAQALHYALDRPEWRAEAGARGRQRAGSFTWHAMAQRNLDIMERDLARARSKF